MSVTLDQLMLERLDLALKVVAAVEIEYGPVILPTASARVGCALRELRRFDGRLVEAFRSSK